MSRLIDLTGQRFGRLVVSGRAGGTASNGMALWECSCDCGGQHTVDGYRLRKGLVKSCGCLMHEWQHASHAVHGESNSRLYGIWIGMKDRCNRENNSSFEHYGGRGIRVCPEWDASFEAFLQWAITSGYENNLTIDRIDVDGDYSPGNCRWASRAEQSRNRRHIVYLTYQGETKPLWKWAELTGIPLYLLQGRSRRGWPAERIFNEPVHENCRNHRSKKINESQSSEP